MKRRRRKAANPDAILSADWHIRGDRPRSRTDDFVQAMKDKVHFILELARRHNCSIYIAGDLGHRFTWPNHLLSWFFEIMNSPFFTANVLCIPGQHDLKNHRIEEISSGGLGVIEEGAINNIEILHTELGNIENIESGYNRTMGITHQFVWSGESDDYWPGQDAPQGEKLLKDNPKYDLIVSGDNHKPFVAEYKDQLLVNPGSLMRTTAAQINHRPRVYLYYAETNSVKPVYLPIEKDVIDRFHIDIDKRRKEKRLAYIERVNKEEDLSLDFEDNIEIYFKKNRTSKRVKEKVGLCL